MSRTEQQDIVFFKKKSFNFVEDEKKGWCYTVAKKGQDA